MEIETQALTTCEVAADGGAISQSSDPTQGMVTLRTVDGFSVCFSIPRQQQNELGEALVARPTPEAAPRTH